MSLVRERMHGSPLISINSAETKVTRTSPCLVRKLTSKFRTEPSVESRLMSSALWPGSAQIPISMEVRPISSSRLQPVIRSFASLTSTKRPSLALVKVSINGLCRKALENISSDFFSASSIRLLSVTSTARPSIRLALPSAPYWNSPLDATQRVLPS